MLNVFLLSDVFWKHYNIFLSLCVGGVYLSCQRFDIVKSFIQENASHIKDPFKYGTCIAYKFPLLRYRDTLTLQS